MRMMAVAGAVLGAGVLHVAMLAVPAQAQTPALTEKINAYIGCINRLSERSYLSRQRYFSWASKNGPTGKERIIYGTYTIYDTSDCQKNVERVNALEPREPELEAAASRYVEAVVALEPLLKQADDYYTEQNYKDDKMGKGRAMHPRLVAAWAQFATADEKLRSGIDAIQDKNAAARLAEIEKAEGRSGRYHIEAVMISAKRLSRLQGAEPVNLAAVMEALGEYEAIAKSMEDVASKKESQIGSSFVSSAKSFLVTSKHLMRRVRDKVPYSSGEKMILNTGSGGWMIEGSPARLTRDYNELVQSYNRGARF